MPPRNRIEGGYFHNNDKELEVFNLVSDATDAPLYRCLHLTGCTVYADNEADAPCWLETAKGTDH
jgi:hypothetical protein